MTTRTILLVEDNPDDEMLTLRALKKNRILNDITVARDGAEALDLIFAKASSGEPLPGLVLLDLKLPKVDGLEVMRRIRADERTSIIPVVILTGSKLDEDILAGYRGGANAYVRKPVNFAEFAETVKALGLFWLILNEPVPEFMPQPDDEVRSMNDGYQGNGLDASAPGAAAAPGQSGSSPADAADVTGRPARILILEDEAWDAERAQSLLTSAGLDFTCIVVATRALFVEKLDSFRPDVILSDYHLPGFSGEAALAITQERYPHVPFIIWSGVLGDEAAVALIKQGATDYVLKDRPARLPSVIGRALAEAEQRMRLADLDEQLGEAQRLASLGHLGAAEQAMNLTRELLATARQEVTTAESPS